MRKIAKFPKHFPNTSHLLAIFLNNIHGNEVVFDSMLVMCTQEQGFLPCWYCGLDWFMFELCFPMGHYSVHQCRAILHLFSCLVGSGYIIALRRKFILCTLPVQVLVFWCMESMSHVVTRPATNQISGRSRVDSIFCWELFFVSFHVWV